MTSRKPIEIRNVSLEPLRIVCERLRAQDEVEVYLMARKPVLEALRESVERSEESYIGYIDGNPEAIFGVSDAFPGVGFPWMVGTDELARNARSWLELSRLWIDRMHDRYPTLTNFVHKRNTKAINWLKHMGFQFLETPVPGLPDFIQFVRYK